MIDEKSAMELREELNEAAGIHTNVGCPRSLERAFYHFGLPFLPKIMTGGEVKGLIIKACPVNLNDNQTEKIFQQLQTDGMICGTLGSGFCFDRTILKLVESSRRSGCYEPYKWNPMYDY